MKLVKLEVEKGLLLNYLGRFGLANLVKFIIIIPYMDYSPQPILLKSVCHRTRVYMVIY